MKGIKMLYKTMVVFLVSMVVVILLSTIIIVGSGIAYKRIPACNVITEQSVSIDGKPGNHATMVCTYQGLSWDQEVILTRWK